MSQILTITLSPALDVATSVDAIVAGAKLRCDEPRYDPGGGGVNVSRAILRLEGQSEAFVAFGGETGSMALSMLKAEGIEPIHFPVNGNTRQSMAVFETSTGKQYRFQLPAPRWPPEQTAALLGALQPHLTQGRMVVMSGSLPAGVPVDTGNTINRMAVENGASMILDTSGDALVSAAANTGPPFALLRMDGAEATEVSGCSFASPGDLADYGLTLIASGAADRLVMSIGSKGTVGVTAEERFFCQPPKIETRSAVGAGDSMVAAIALQLSAGNSFRDAVRHGVAAAGSAVMTPATQLCSKQTADEILDRVVTSEI